MLAPEEPSDGFGETRLVDTEMVCHFGGIVGTRLDLQAFRAGNGVWARSVPCLGSAMQMLPAATYREALESQPSPKSQNAPREQQILLVDFATDDQALVKIRVRINKAVYVDYLTYHRIDGDWLVTAKGFHGGT